jgi:hypothetical protein
MTARFAQVLQRHHFSGSVRPAAHQHLRRRAKVTPAHVKATNKSGLQRFYFDRVDADREAVYLEVAEEGETSRNNGT